MQRFITKTYSIVALGLWLAPKLSLAQCVPGEVGNDCVNTLNNPLKFKTIGAFLLGAVNIFATIGGVIAVFGILYSGFLFVIAQGNEQKLATAKKAFLWSVVGLAVIVSAMVLVTAIQGTINLISA